MPETPYYYIRKKSIESAEKALTWLRGTTDIREELNQMSNLIETELKQRGRILDLITTLSNRRASIIMLILISAQQLSGTSVVVIYMNIILQRTSLQIDSNLVVILVGMLSLFGNILPIYVIDRYGRKPLLLISSCGTCCSLIMIAIYFHLERVGNNVNSIHWLPLLGVIGVLLITSFGLAGVPYTVLSEIYPTNVKAYATMITAIYGSVLGATLSKIYQVITDAWGDHVMFYFLGAAEFTFGTLILTIVPETKGKSFKEIQENLAFDEHESKDSEN